MYYSVEQSYHSNEEMSDAESVLEVLSRQEENFYLIDDYLQKIPPHSSVGQFPVDTDARRRIAKWCISVIEAFDCSKEIAEIIMSCLDRFVSTEDGKSILLDRAKYQLAALTALYSSVKIHNPTAFSLDLMSQMSRHEFSRYDIEAMERRMLDAIQWRVNPPTVMDFVRIYLDLTPVWNWLDTRTQGAVLELIDYQINLSMVDFEVSTSKASHIAIASLLNATKSMYSAESTLYESIRDVTTIYCSDVEPKFLKQLQQKLEKGMPKENKVKIKALDELMCGRPVHVRSDSFAESPRSVYQYNLHTV